MNLTESERRNATSINIQLNTQNNITEPTASNMTLTTKNMTQKLDNHGTNVSESQLINSDPFKEQDSIQKMNLSNTLESQDKDLTNKSKTRSSSSSPQASDSSCANDGNESCKEIKRLQRRIVMIQKIKTELAIENRNITLSQTLIQLRTKSSWI